MKPVLALVLIIPLALALACGREASDRSDRRSQPIERPRGPEELVLRVETGGGFVPAEMRLTELPTFSLYGNGRMITLGPQIMIYPGPALPNLIETTVSQEGVDAIVQAAARAGLSGEDRQYPLDTVADAPTTTFTLVTDGKRHVVSVYALGLEESARLSEEDREDRAKLSEFRDRLSALESWLPRRSVGEERRYEIKRLRVFVRPQAPVPQDPALQQTPIEWPLPTPLSSFGAPTSVPELRCGVVEGEELKASMARVEQANQLTPWISEGLTYTVLFRPLLPDESGC